MISKINGFYTSLLFIVITCSLLIGFIAVTLQHRVNAACSTPEQYGSVTSTVNIPSNGSYRIWSRIMAPDATANSYYLDIDGTTCGIVVGDSAINANSWTWVDYKDATSASKITVSLTAGSHTFKMIGREAGVKLDRVVLTTDTACTPTGTGDNCANPPDTTPPTVSLTSPAAGSTVSGTIDMVANATDDSGTVSKVEFYIDNVLKATDTAAPWTYSFSTTTLTNATHSFTAKAFDAANNSTTSNSISATVNNTSAYLAEDINQDGKVNLIDFSLLASKYGQTGTVTTLGRSDINQDGKVNLIDFSLLASKYGYGV